MGKTCGIWTQVNNLLKERLILVRIEEKPRWATVRNFFYEARNKYLKAHPDRLTIDTDDRNPYVATHKKIKKFCKENCQEFDIIPEHWFRLRDLLNIHPQGRAACKGESGNFLITRETRDRVVSNCSFIIVCEKDTIVRNLLPALTDERYKPNVVSTGGNSPADVQEVILQIKDELGEDANFYILVLHDYDLSGVRILVTLKQRYEGVIDIGVNRQFIEFLKKDDKFDARLAEEATENKIYQTGLREIIKSGLYKEYTLEDFDYLQGEKIAERKWAAKRIEIDAIEVMYGIQPFIDYALAKIKKECKVWDLSRIGVDEFELEEPDNRYEKRVKDFERKVGQAYGKKLHTLGKTMNKVLDIVKDTLPQPQSYADLVKEHREGHKHYWSISGSDGSYRFHICETKGVQELKEEYTSQIDREWVKDYEDDLKEINEQIENYEGDVREGEDDLSGQAEELQSKLDDDKKKDPDIDKFKEALHKIDWGEEALGDLEIPDPAEDVRKVIEALETYVKELEGGEDPDED